MALPPDDDVVDQRYAEQASGVGQSLGERVVSGARSWIAARVVVHHGDRGRSSPNGGREDLPGMHYAGIHRAPRHLFSARETAPSVQENSVKGLNRPQRQPRVDAGHEGLCAIDPRAGRLLVNLDPQVLDRLPPPGHTHAQRIERLRACSPQTDKAPDREHSTLQRRPARRLDPEGLGE